MHSKRWTLERIEGSFCGLLTGVMTLLIFGDVVLRYAFNSPIGWSDELALLFFTWLVFLGSAVGLSRRAHISIDTLVQMLPPAFRPVVAAIADFLILIILVVLIYYGILLCAITVKVPTPSLGVPVALVYAAAPIGALLMLVHHLQHLGTSYLAWRRGAMASQGERG